MSLRINCDECLRFGYQGQKPAHTLRTLLREEGWTTWNRRRTMRTQDGPVDLCPKCSMKAKAKP